MRNSNFYSLVLEDSQSVSSAWMPFLKPGGLFVATRREHVLGNEIVLLVHLPGGAKYSVAGRVAWINAESLPGQRRHGIGVAFEGSESSALIAELSALFEGDPAPENALLAYC